MSNDDLIKIIRDRMDTAGISWTDACNAAGVPHSTFWRWTVETPKTLKLYAELSNAVDYLIDQKSAKHENINNA